ncbi:unnamed protein product [Urochloa humidicola]
MASSSYHVRRPWEESSSSRRKRPRYRPVMHQASSPSSPPTSILGYSPTSPSYAPTSPTYSPTDPLNRPPAPAAYSPEEPRHGEDVIGDEEACSEGQEDEEEQQQRSGSERDGSDGYDGEEDAHRRRRQLRDEEDDQSDGEQDYFSDGSDGENGVEDDEQQASHLLQEEEEQEPLHLHDEEQQRRSGSEGEQEHPDGSDGGNGLEDEHQAGGEQEEEAPTPQAHGEDATAAADGDLSAAPPRPSSPALSIRSESSSAVVGEMTVDRTAGLDCGICFLPLKPPIFQCDVGHVVCSPCRDKLAARGRCHVCRDPTGFRRCHAMEQVVDAVRVPCPHAAHGCADRPTYHDRERHARECPHAPYRCPAGGAGCGFAGSAPALAEHVAAVHGWPCTTEPASHGCFGIDLRNGFNFFISSPRGGGGCSGAQHVLLLNVASTPFGRAVSVVRARPQAATSISSPATASNTSCGIELRYTSYKLAMREHTQRSRIHVAWADLSAGLPDPRTSFQFFVPKYAGGHGDDEAAFHVTALIAIS